MCNYYLSLGALWLLKLALPRRSGSMSPHLAALWQLKLALPRRSGSLSPHLGALWLLKLAHPRRSGSPSPHLDLGTLWVLNLWLVYAQVGGSEWDLRGGASFSSWSGEGDKDSDL